MPAYYTQHEDHSEVLKYGAPIWDHLFLVQMRYRDTKTIEELRHFGLPTVGNSVLDKQIHNEIVTIMITMNDIVEHFRVGTRVEFVNNGDCEYGYDMVNDYLKAWNSQLQRGVNLGNAPIEDLLLLDKLATVLYEQSRYFNGPRKRAELSFVAALQSGSLFNKLAMLGLGNNGESVQPEEANGDRHLSFAEAFSSKVFSPSPTKTANAAPVSTSASRWK